MNSFYKWGVDFYRIKREMVAKKECTIKNEYFCAHGLEFVYAH